MLFDLLKLLFADVQISHLRPDRKTVDFQLEIREEEHTYLVPVVIRDCHLHLIHLLRVKRTTRQVLSTRSTQYIALYEKCLF